MFDENALSLLVYVNTSFFSFPIFLPMNLSMDPAIARWMMTGRAQPGLRGLITLPRLAPPSVFAESALASGALAGSASLALAGAASAAGSSLDFAGNSAVTYSRPKSSGRQYYILNTMQWKGALLSGPIKSS